MQHLFLDANENFWEKLMEFDFTRATSDSQIEIFNTEYLPIIEAAFALGLDTKTYMLNNQLTVRPINIMSKQALLDIIYYASGGNLILGSECYISSLRQLFGFLFNVTIVEADMQAAIDREVERRVREEMDKLKIALKHKEKNKNRVGFHEDDFTY